MLLIKQELKVLNSRENLPAIYNSEGTTPTILNITDNLNYNWKNKPKRVWEGLTGKYYTLPLIGAIGTRGGLKND